MLTFEKVLEVFQAYLDDDPLYEVVQTSHGYTLMAWGTPPGMTGIAPRYRKPQRIYGTLCWVHTPTFWKIKITGNERELTVTENQRNPAEVSGTFGKSAGNLDIEMPEGRPRLCVLLLLRSLFHLSAPSMAPSIIGRYSSGRVSACG